ncbi:molybdopterin-dependent oxidoreductase [Streptomyces sp. ISL-87]|nr:molybdopterin-dependent oxidoreductase [Streptomyces sp. ISL-21]MBT2610184.1 molybdopterin-dependent oxidoreductase [Streptomyces sp. ISL-87]
MVAFGFVGAAAAVLRPDAGGAADALPSLAGGFAGALALSVLSGRLTPAATPSGDEGVGAGWSRRGFLLAASATTVAATGAGVLGRAVNGRRGRGAAASRNTVVLPPPASPAPAIPRGAVLNVPGISAFTTPNRDFYRVDTALVVPRIDAGTWRLRIHGKGVARPRTYTFEDLLSRPLSERDITLTCVSNEVGGPYAGNARWLGVPLAETTTPPCPPWSPRSRRPDSSTP